MPKIRFSEANHRYLHRNGEDYLSVSKKFSKFKEPFDSYNIAKKSTLIVMFPKEYAKLKLSYDYNNPIVIQKLEELADPKELAIKIKTLTDTWSATGNKAREFGTMIHKIKELEDLKLGYTWCPLDGRYYDIINPSKTYDNQSLADNLYDLEDGCYPELLLFDDETKTAGQSDKIYISTINNKRIVHISDYKTDAKILYKPDFYERGVGYKTLLNDLAHLRACNYNEYSVKMSMYGLMLEKAGFIVGKIEIEQLVTDETKEIITTNKFKVPYRAFEAQIVMEN